MNFKPVIGLEIHVELKTKSKMFCQCSADYFGAPPNSHVCPVCLGMPGALPVPNKKAIESVILIGKALNCEINKQSKFDRKHYFYPDLPKGYQISQYDEPFCVNGHLDINGKTFRIRRVHMEEDTGKLAHEGTDTLIDFNRSSVPLVEIVTEADFDNAEDSKAFLEELQTIIRYLNVSDADMEKGSMRCEPNISIKIDSDKGEFPPYKVEVKNINSFNYVKQAIEFELKRQAEIREKGEIPVQETRGYNEHKKITYSQRSKEEAHDYRYFPEPDIPPFNFTDEVLGRIFSKMPELPAQKVEKYAKLGIKYSDAFTITRDKKVVFYFDELLEKAKEHKIPAQTLANLIVNKKIETTLPTDQFVKKALEMSKPKETNMDQLNEVITKVLAANEKSVADYKNGKQNAIMFLVGQVMREMKGKADASTVKSELEKLMNDIYVNKYIKYKQALKIDIETLMGEKMTNGEFLPFAELFIEGMRKKVITQKTYSEQRFEDFVNQGSHIIFTPKAILEIIKVIIIHTGDQTWETSSKFKRLRELYDAIRLLLVFKKMKHEEFFIESSDNQNGDPDIRIVPPSWIFKVKIEKFPMLEIMSMLQRDVEKFDEENLAENIANFIEDKKFNRDYGSDSTLLVHFDFNSSKFSTKNLKTILEKSKKKNPFKSIWVTAWTSEDLKEFVGIQLYPVYNVVTINRQERIDLLY